MLECWWCWLKFSSSDGCGDTCRVIKKWAFLDSLNRPANCKGALDRWCREWVMSQCSGATIVGYLLEENGTDKMTHWRTVWDAQCVSIQFLSLESCGVQGVQYMSKQIIVTKFSSWTDSWKAPLIDKWNLWLSALSWWTVCILVKSFLKDHTIHINNPFAITLKQVGGWWATVLSL